MVKRGVFKAREIRSKVNSARDNNYGTGTGLPARCSLVHPEGAPMPCTAAHRTRAGKCLYNTILPCQRSGRGGRGVGGLVGIILRLRCSLTLTHSLREKSYWEICSPSDLTS